ncbi:MAG: hypothetical protein QXG00_07265 [Candidatus Woesearchaeota archaeon]
MKRFWENILNLIDKKTNLTLLILLSIQLLLRLIIFFTTNTFAFTDWRGYLAGIEQIKAGESLPLFYRAFTYLLSYIGYFFKYILGNLDYFFIFNSFLGVLVSLVSFFIVKEISNNHRKAIFVVLLQTIYVEFLAFSSIFYTVIIMLLLVNLIIYLLIKIIKEEKLFKLIIYGLLSILIAYLTYFFKIELIYFTYLLLIFALINIKQKPLFVKFFVLGLIFLFSIITFNIYQKQFYVNTGKITHVFFGHTYYGGFGGEGSFIFTENQEKYETRMKEYFEKNNIKSPNPKDTGNFQKHEMFNFIKKEPHMWFLLQVRKFFFTFGIVPEGNSFTILYKGLFNRNFIITSAIIVFPVVFFVILFIFAIKKESFKLIFNDKKLLFMFLMLFYYLAATIFYGPYQERYRIPVIVMFILPFIAIFSDNLSFKVILSNKKSLIIKILILLSFVIAWSYQAYEALILSKERYGIVFEKDF